jgi:hypothetical protein
VREIALTQRDDMLARILAAVTLAAVCGLAAGLFGSKRKYLFDDVGALKQHSFHLPILEDYVGSGLHAWSFGGAAVVTNDYVRLTPAAGDGHGYLWNQYPSELKSFRAHFSLKLVQRPHKGSMFGAPSCQTCGVALWVLKEPTRHSDVPFFGVPARFQGLGVVIHQDGELHVVYRSADSDSTPETINDVSVAKCRLSLGGSQAVLELMYTADDQKAVLTYGETGASSMTQCAVATGITLPERYYFGFTAAAKESSPMAYDVAGMMLSPLFGATEKPLDDLAIQKARRFDLTIDKQEREFWDGTQPDEDPSGDKNIADRAVRVGADNVKPLVQNPSHEPIQKQQQPAQPQQRGEQRDQLQQEADGSGPGDANAPDLP